MAGTNSSALEAARPVVTQEDAFASPKSVAEALTFIANGASPESALEAAIAMREELTGLLIEELALAPIDVAVRYGAAPEGTTYYLHEMAMHLIAAWREPAGWRLILDFFMSDCDLAVELCDFGLEAYLPAMLVRTYDGSDLGHLEILIATEGFDPIFRQLLVQAYYGLVATGKASRERLISFLATQLAAPETAIADGWWDWLALRAAEVQSPELRPAIEALIVRGLTLPATSGMSLVSADIVARIYAEPTRDILANLLLEAHFDNLPRSVSRWSWFAAGHPQERPVTLPWGGNGLNAG